MKKFTIQQPRDLSAISNKYTRKNPDYTANDASGRTLFINFGILKYGVTDKAHAGAIFFGLILIVMLFLLLCYAMLYSDNGILKKICEFILSSLFVAIGVAIGRNSSQLNKEEI